MEGGFRKNYSIVLSIMVLLTQVVFSIADDEQVNPNLSNGTSLDVARYPVAVKSQPIKPIRPKNPDCSGFFPGTPGWNECFQRFQQDMANFQLQMHDYVKDKVQSENGGQYYSGTSYSNSQSTSNSNIGGYSIQAVNMGMSTSVNQNTIKISLFTGPIDKIENKVNGNEIRFNILSNGQRKRVTIVVPDNVGVKDVQIDRTSDTIYVTGPVSFSNVYISNTNHQTSQSQSSSGAFGSPSFINQNVGQGTSQIPAIPIPEFPNIFQNMFQNMFQNIFGARSLPMPNTPKQPAQYVEPFYTPQIWFF